MKLFGHLVSPINPTSFRKEHRPGGTQAKIPNHKFQISSKFQFQITKTISFRIWVIGIYLELGAWDLVLPYAYTYLLILKPHLLISFPCRLDVLVPLSRNLFSNSQRDGIDSYQARHL